MPRRRGWSGRQGSGGRGGAGRLAGPSWHVSALLLQIHSLYRRTGASFQKAQQEFTAGVFSNPAVRTAAANAASGAAENAFWTP